MPSHFPQLGAALDDYRARHPGDGELVAAFGAFLASHAAVFERGHLLGHFTGSAWLVSADGARVLLMHHRKLDRWLQPGGHADPGEARGEEVALREAAEETGIAGLALHPKAPAPFDVDVHAIPARKDEPAHEHLDVRYLFIAPEGALATVDAAEAHAFAWVPLDEVTTGRSDASVARAARKIRQLLGR